MQLNNEALTVASHNLMRIRKFRLQISHRPQNWMHRQFCNLGQHYIDTWKKALDIKRWSRPIKGIQLAAHTPRHVAAAPSLTKRFISDTNPDFIRPHAGKEHLLAITTL